MIAPGAVVGHCEGCEKPILSGEGITIDPDRGEWHPDCRKQHLQTDAVNAAQAPKRRGRPPKTAPVPE